MKKIFLIIVCMSFMFKSCKTAYKPNAVNVPLLQEKGEAKVYVSFNDYQLAYAATNHIGVMINGQNFKRSTSSTINGDVSDFKQTNNVFEAGVGYFGKTKKSLIYELYGGLGFAKTKIIDKNSSSITGTYNASGLKFFIQPNIGFTSNGFDIALSPRLTGLYYGDPKTEFSSAYLSNSKLDQIGNKAHLFLEPVVTIRGGFKYLKLQTQLGFSAKLTKAEIPYNAGILNIGLVFDWGKWYSKKK